MATSTISNTIKDASGAAVSGVTIVARLKPGPAFRVSDSSEIAGQVTTITNGSGVWTLALEQTANLTPTGTWWEIEEQIPDSLGGRKVWAVSVGSTDATLQASLVTQPPGGSSIGYLTQTAGDGRYSLAVPAGTAVQYMSTLGDDGNNGSTWGTAKATLAAALAALPAGGGTVMIGAGVYPFTSAAVISKSHTALVAAVPRGVTFQATADIGNVSPNGWQGIVQVYQSTTPLTDLLFDGIVFDANGKSYTPALSLIGVKRVIARNCQFTGSGANAVHTVGIIGGQFDASIAAAASSDIRFQRCEFGPSSSKGLRTGGGHGSTDTPTLSDVSLEDCYVHDNGLGGVSNGMEGNRTIWRIQARGCRFENNATGTPAAQVGHFSDDSKTGWVDCLVEGSYFGDGNDNCGGFSDHKGRRIHVRDNVFKVRNTAGSPANQIWPVALGDTRTGAEVDRTWFAWIEDNYFEDCGSWDFDSCHEVHVRRNVFYRGRERAFACFGEHVRTLIEDNEFIEGSQALLSGQTGIQYQSPLQAVPGLVVRRNVFRDDQGTPTQLGGIFELSGDPNTLPLVYEDNDFTTMATPITKVGGYDAQRYVRRNQGVNPGVPALVALGASPFTLTASDTPIDVHLRDGGSGVGVTKGGVQIVSGTPATVALDCHESMVIIYSTAPNVYQDRR